MHDQTNDTFFRQINTNERFNSEVYGIKANMGLELYSETPTPDGRSARASQKVQRNSVTSHRSIRYSVSTPRMSYNDIANENAYNTIRDPPSIAKKHVLASIHEDVENINENLRSSKRHNHYQVAKERLNKDLNRYINNYTAPIHKRNKIASETVNPVEYMKKAETPVVVSGTPKKDTYNSIATMPSYIETSAKKPRRDSYHGSKPSYFDNSKKNVIKNRNTPKNIPINKPPPSSTNLDYPKKKMHTNRTVNPNLKGSANPFGFYNKEY